MEIEDIVRAEFSLKIHASMLKAQVKSSGIKMTSIDGQRIYIAFFVLNSLDMLDKIDSVFTAAEKLEVIEWIYRLQIVNRTDSGLLIGGFRGSECGGYVTEYINGVAIEQTVKESSRRCDQSMIVFSQCALASLLILGDDLSRVSVKHLVSSLARQQDQILGTFKSQEFSEDYDLRFLYSALLIEKILKIKSLDHIGFVNHDLALKAILNAQNDYDGAFGLSPNLESHGGSTFCAIAALDLLGQLENIPFKTQLIHWLVNRQQLLIENHHCLEPEEQIQVEIISEAEYNLEKMQEKQQQQQQQEQQTNDILTSPVAEKPIKQEEESANASKTQKLDCVGFNGRVNKFPDSCYTTWIGASLVILGFQQFLARDNILRFLKICENAEGGFQKYPFDQKGDPVHTHFSLVGLHLLNKITLPKGDSVDFSLLLRKSRL